MCSQRLVSFGHVVDQIRLMAQVHSSSIRYLEKLRIVNHGEPCLHDKIHLVRKTPDTQDIICRLLLEQSDDSTVTACHGVLAIRRKSDQLIAPTGIDNVHDLCDQIDLVDGGVPIKHGNEQQVQVDEESIHLQTQTMIHE